MISAQNSLRQKLLNRKGKPTPRELLRYCGVLSIVTAGSVTAQQTDHPVTAGLVFVIGIMINGALGGLGAGLCSAVAASFMYNFFIRFPVFTFGFSSIDDYVPLVAFNITAIVSGWLSGRLKDRVQSAEFARSQLDLLLAFSSRLQRAVDFDDVASALGEAVSSGVAKTMILPYLEEHYPPRRIEMWRAAINRQLLEREEGPPPEAGEKAAEDRLIAFENIELSAFVSLLAMAIERCDLLDEQTQSEALKRSEQFKTALLSSLSHDLRTPIAAISASATSLIKFGHILERETRSDMLHTIQNQCERLNRFTAKLLSLGQLQGGISDRQFEIVDVADALGCAIASVRGIEAERKIIKNVGNMPMLVNANPVMLEQILFNILENAVSYSPPHTSITVDVVLGDALLSLFVIDEGLGIAQADIEHIFDRFFRGNHNVHGQGQGLGLSIAKGFAEAFGGQITATSPAPGSGRGTQVAVVLPLAMNHMRRKAGG